MLFAMMIVSIFLNLASPKFQQQSLIAVLIQQESTGYDYAVGDDGKALGCLQIHRDYWFDASQYGGVVNDPAWSYRRATRNRAKSIQLVRWYWQRYALTAYKLGNMEVLARIHKGGPQGYHRRSTLAYWEDIRARLLAHGIQPDWYFTRPTAIAQGF